MGISKAVFQKTGGFKFDRYAEDIELSIRIKKMGFMSGYISDAYVYHKRRTNLKQFFSQVYNFGRGRVLVGKAHKGAIKVTHMFPALFMLGLILGLILVVFKPTIGLMILTIYLLYFFSITLSAFLNTKSLGVSLLAGPSAFVQLIGYGWGFLSEIFGNSR